MASDSPAQPQQFLCPNCGANLPLPDAASVECEYCGARVLTPPEYLLKKASEIPEPSPYYPTTTVIQIDATPDTALQPAKRPIAWTILILVGLCILIGAGFSILAAAGLFVTTDKATRSIESITNANADVPTELFELIPSMAPILDTEAPTPLPFAGLVLSFGDEGSGPGQFLDPRRIAVDQEGNIFVADYSSGRVQKFDSAGKFMQMWMVEPDSNQNNYITDMAVDYTGRLYVARGGDILVFEGDNQKPSETIQGDFPNTYYEALATDPANNLYALARAMSGQDLVKLSQDGEIILRSKDVVSGVDPNTPPQGDVIAADGLGNTYFVSVFDPQIFKYDSKGEYADRLGSPGNEPEQLNHASMVAVDGSGRLYLLDSSAIKILDKNGSFLQSIPWDYSLGSPRDLALDNAGKLYVVTSRNLILKFNLAW